MGEQVFSDHVSDSAVDSVDTQQLSETPGLSQVRPGRWRSALAPYAPCHFPGQRALPSPPPLTRSRALTAQGGTPGTAIAAQSWLGVGEPLPGAVKARWEERLGYQLDQVRLHRGEEATELAQAFGARAFALGRSVAFGSGEYKPHDVEGDRLLGHELTHLVQQQEGRVSGAGVVRDPTLEREADRGARRPGGSGRPLLPLAPTVPSAIQLEPLPTNHRVEGSGQVGDAPGDPMALRIAVEKFKPIAERGPSKDATWATEDISRAVSELIKIIEPLGPLPEDHMHSLLAAIAERFPPEVVIAVIERLAPEWVQGGAGDPLKLGQLEEPYMRPRIGWLLAPIGDEAIEASHAVDSYARATGHGAASLHAFFGGLTSGVRDDLDATDMERLARQLGEASVTPFAPAAFAAGAAARTIEDLVALPGEIRELIENWELLLDAAKELIALLLSPEGTAAATILGDLFGRSAAGELRRLSVIDSPYEFSLELGKLIGPTVIGIIAAYVLPTGLVTGIAAKFAGQVLMRLRHKLPTLEKLAKRVADAERRFADLLDEMGEGPWGPQPGYAGAGPMSTAPRYDAHFPDTPASGQPGGPYHAMSRADDVDPPGGLPTGRRHSGMEAGEGDLEPASSRGLRGDRDKGAGPEREEPERGSPRVPDEGKLVALLAKHDWSWSKVKKALQGDDGGAETLAALVAFRRERVRRAFRQVRQEMMEDGQPRILFNQTGSRSPDSDVDISVYGVSIRDEVEAIRRFEELMMEGLGDGARHRGPGEVFDTNAYAAGEFGIPKAADPKRPGGGGEVGSGRSRKILNDTIRKADEQDQRIYALLNIRRYMTQQQWDDYVLSQLNSIPRRKDEQKHELKELLKAVNKRYHELEVEIDTKVSSGNTTSRPAARKEAYLETLEALAKKDTERAGLTPEERQEKFDVLTAEIRHLQSKANYFAEEAHISEGAYHHVVGRLQTRSPGVDLGVHHILDSMYEQYGFYFKRLDGVPELTPGGVTGAAGLGADLDADAARLLATAKYAERLLNTVQRLLEMPPEARIDALDLLGPGLTKNRVKEIRAILRTIDRLRKGSDEFEGMNIETKAANLSALMSELAKKGIGSSDELTRLLQGLMGRAGKVFPPPLSTRPLP